MGYLVNAKSSIEYEGAGGASITRAQFDDILGDCNVSSSLFSTLLPVS